MASSQFIDIPEIVGVLNSYNLITHQPNVYKIPVTYLQNLSNGNMIIDSCSNIVLQARNTHVRVNNKMGIGLDPSSAYSLHVLGDTCISGNITCSENISSRTANINDVSVVSIDVSLNLNPLVPNKGTIGLSSRPWGNAYINDVSVSSIDVSTNLNPLVPNKGTIGLSTRPWGNAYINDVSVSNISISGNIMFSISGGSMRIAADTSTNSITTSHRIYQQISGDISWTSVNGYYGLAKDAYPALNPYSSGAKAVQTWTKRTTYPNDSSTWNSICWSPKLGLFVAVASSGTKRVMTSKNGIVWSTVDLSNNNTQLTSVCWSPQLEIFVAVFANNTTDTTANKVVTSSNGTTWIERANGVISNGWTSVCWSAELSLFVAVANAGTNPRVMYSSDGTIWNSITSGVNNDNNWNSICWSPELGIFVAVAFANGAGTNSVMTSKNGKDWTSLVSPITVFSICWSAQLGIFVAVGAFNTNNVMISSDGKNWITRPLVSTGTSVCWSASLGIFVVTTNQVGADIRMMYSYDGLNWIPIPNIEFQHWSSICWSSELGIFAVVGYLATSPYFNRKVMTSSLQGRPPTSYNVFDSSFNSIDENGNWTFSAIDISTNLNPSLPNSGSLGLSNKRWANAFVNDLSVNTLTVSDLSSNNITSVINSLVSRIAVLETKSSNSVYKIQYLRWNNTITILANTRRDTWRYVSGDTSLTFNKIANTKIIITTVFPYDMGSGARYNDVIRSKLIVEQVVGVSIVQEGEPAIQRFNDAPGGGTRSGVLTDCCVILDSPAQIALSGTLTVSLMLDETGFDDAITIYPGHFQVTHLYS